MSVTGPSLEPAVSLDPLGLMRHLETSELFHRDSAAGRVLHPGTVSFRERVIDNSVHIMIVGNRVLAHIDRYAPLTTTRAGAARYSFWRVVAHNLAHLAENVARLLSGRGGTHRCELQCERIEVGDEAADEAVVVPERCSDLRGTR